MTAQNTITGNGISEQAYLALRHLDSTDVFKLACVESGKGMDQIAREMGWGISHAKRIFSANRYFPTYEDLPKFCAVVGNQLIVQWLQIMAEGDGQPPKHAEVDCSSLVFRIGELFSEAGDVGAAGQSAIEDMKLEPRELRRIMKELRDVIVKSLALMGDIRAQERQLAKGASGNA